MICQIEKGTGKIENKFDVTDDNLEHNCKIEKYLDKFGQFAKKYETAMKLVPMEATILIEVRF